MKTDECAQTTHKAPCDPVCRQGRPWSHHRTEKRVSGQALACLLLWLPAECGSSLAAQEIDFAHDIVPILKARCVECHGGEKSEGGFSLNSRALMLDAEAVVPGNPSASRLIELITSADPEDQMPPRDRDRLDAREVKLLTRWVAGGLSWEPGYTFADRRYEPPLRPRRPPLPAPIAGRTHPIDRVIDNQVTARGQRLPQPVSDSTFIRRAFLDCIGLLPTLEERSRFLEDSRANKREALIDELLSRDGDYADHWMSFWNDLLRNAYAGTGYIDGGRRQISGWLYRALYENKPYDQFTTQLIAPESDASSGFIRGIKWRGNVNASQVRELQFSQSVSQVFLGINMKCASCHDSFIDRWTLDEAYGLAAVYSERELQIHRCDKPIGRVAKAAWIFPELGTIDASAKQPERLRQLAGLITHPENGRFTRTITNRIWHRFMGRGIVHPVDAMGTEPWNPDLLDLLASQLVDEQYDLRKLMRFVMTSEAYQSRSSVRQEEAGEYVYTGPVARRLTAEQFIDAIRGLAGVWPRPAATDFNPGGRGQGGQLNQFRQVRGEAPGKWEAPLRAALLRPDALQATLGRPNREQIVSERPDQLTTLEALNLSNAEPLNRLLSETATALAERQLSAAALAELLYLRLLSRPPTATESRVAQGTLGSTPTAEGIADLLWMIVALPEFQLVR